MNISDISVEPASAKIDGTVYEGTLATGAACFAYVPAVEGYGTRPTSSPILLVYGDAAYTAETAKETALCSGLAEIADREKCPVLFLNPKGARWTAEDADSYLAAKNLYSDSSNDSYDHNGQRTEAHGPTGLATPASGYPGNASRIYVFAEGAGADFAYENLAVGIYGPGQYMGSAVWRPAGLLLLNGSSEKTADFHAVECGDYAYAENDLARQLPVVIAGGTDAMAAAFAALNDSENTLVLPGEPCLNEARSTVLQAYDELLEHHFTRDSSFGVSLLRLNAAASLGLTETRETFTASNGNVVTYYQYLPAGMDRKEAGTVPLVFGFHGGGNTAEFYTWSSGWDQVAGENALMYVAVDRHVVLEDEIMELLAALEAKYPQIDRQRIYASGFSMGSIKSGLLAFRHDDVFAAIAPTNAISFLEKTAHGNLLPVFYNAGENSHFNLPEIMGGTKAEVPTLNLEGRAVFGKLLVTNKVLASEDDYTFDEAADKLFGIAPSRTEIVPCPGYANVQETIRCYDSADGSCCTVMSTTSNAGHEPIREVTRNAWVFMSQFSRNADGTLTID